ncbi:MAG: pilus assembly protein [Hydrogenophilaceae bacterium]|nr:pilus assembly protein [Hydrogenophilaceae bacterium]
MGRARMRRALTRFARRKDGAAAVEFALIALPFFLLLTALAEVSLMSFAQTNLDLAISDLGRTIRTGQAAEGDMGAEDVESMVCERLNRIMPMDCSENLYVDVDHYDTFNDVDNPVPLANGALDETDIGFEQTGPGEIVLVRGYYRWEVITPFFQSIFGNVNGTDRLMVSSMLFRNEPWPEDAE